MKYAGNQRHFFSKPRSDVIELMHNKNISGNSQQDGKSSMAIYMQVQMSKLSKVIQEKGISLEEIFQKHDHQSNGLINLIQFKYVMTEMLELSIQEVETLIKFFDPKQTNAIKYTDVLSMLQNPNLIDKFLGTDPQQSQ